MVSLKILNSIFFNIPEKITKPLILKRLIHLKPRKNLNRIHHKIGQIIDVLRVSITYRKLIRCIKEKNHKMLSSHPNIYARIN